MKTQEEEVAHKTVLITGTSTGIGTACVERMAAEGWRVYAGVRRPEDGERLRSTIAGDVVPLQIDVTEQADVDAALATVADEVGSLDGLVNNAGIAVAGPIELVDDDEWRRQFHVNFFSVVSLTRDAMGLVEAANGRFVHIGSIAGRIAGGGMGPYAASKHAMEAFNWALRSELSRTEMTSSLIEPGEIKTAIWDKADVSVTELTARIDAAGRRDRYLHVLDGNRGFVAEGRSRGIDAAKVADAVEHALTARRPKARYLVGPDAKLGGVLTRLPDRAFEGAMTLNGKRLERAGRKLP